MGKGYLLERKKMYFIKELTLLLIKYGHDLSADELVGAIEYVKSGLIDTMNLKYDELKIRNKDWEKNKNQTV